MDQAASQEVQRAARACVRCGSCMQVCPVYLAGRQEALSPRGKLALLAQTAGAPGGLSRASTALLANCLLCGRCTRHCPNQVPAMEGLRAGRQLLADQGGQLLGLRLALEQAMPHPARLDLLARAAALGQPLASGLGLRLGLGTGQPLSLSGLPPLAAQPFLARAPRLLPGPAGSPRLGLFVGCVANYLRPGLARRALWLLSQVATVVVFAQGCCGLPALSAGLAPAARQAALAGLAALEEAGVDRVVTTCGSCAHTLAREWPRLAGGEHGPAPAPEVLEISQVLAEHPRLLKKLASPPRQVAVHDPCHLKLGLGVSQEPRELLRAAGQEVVEMAQADACCGGGGLFSLRQPGLSREILEPRLASLAASGARVLATSCSGCYLQWRGGLPPSVEVVHPIELLATPQS